MNIKELPPLPPMPEPDSYLFQHEETGQTMFVDSQQVEWGFEKINPRLKKISGAFTEAQLRDYALQARAQVQGDPSWWRRETDEGAEWTDTAPLVLSGWTPLYTTPQTAQATQAEVTDSMIREAFLANGFTIKDGHSDLKPYVYAAARAILALQKNNFSHELVPMTDDEIDAVQQSWIRQQYGLGSQKGPRGFARAIEAHHGITAQAKKEAP